MKIKTFILTFLMMMSSPFLFGQHWEDPGTLGYQNSMTVYAQVKLDNVVQTNDYQVAAFHGDQLLAVSEIIPFQGTTSNYHVHLQIYGDNSMGNIYFKFFNGTKEYVSETEFPFEVNVNIGDHPNYSTINFYSVAQIGDVVYPSLQKAINACKEGDNTIKLLANISDDVEISETTDVNITIDGGMEKEYSGTINIVGNSTYGNETLTIKAVKFVTSESGHDFIWSDSQNAPGRYANNVTVEDCYFVATGDAVNSAVALRIRQGKNINVIRSLFEGLHSAMQMNGTLGINVDGAQIKNCKSGISASGANSLVVKNSTIEVNNYGVRADGTGAYEMTLTDNTISAELPVVVRKTTGDYKLDINGTHNNYTATNTEGYHVVFTKGDDGTYEAPTGDFQLTIADGTELNVFPVYVAQIGTTKYLSLAEAFTAAQDGDEVKILVAGTYALSTSGKDITITGAVDGVVFDNIGAKNMGGADVTFNKVTFDYYPNVNYTGLQHSGNLVYNDCTFEGQPFLYGTSETFNNCTFNQNSADAYNVWTYGAKEVDFNECIFNSAGKSVLIYAEGASIFNNVNVTKCTFNASAPVEGKAAIEMDSSLTAGIMLEISETTTEGFGTGNVSENSLWNNKKDNKELKNNDITVIVDGVTVLEPWIPVAKIGDVYYTSLAEALDAVKNMSGDVTINLLNNATLDITAWQTLAIGGENTTSITIDGENGEEDFTLTFNKKNSDWNHIATSKDNATDLVLKNIKINDSGYNNGPWNRYDIVFASDVELNNVVSSKALAFKANATLNNVTINESGDNYAIWIQPNGQNVAINGLVINSVGRGIKVDEQYVTAQNVNLSVANATFTTVKKAAIMVKSAANTAITVGENVNISGVSADKTNIAWVDEDAAAHYGKVTVTGGTLTQENLPVFVAALMNGENVDGYYKVFEEALAAAEDEKILVLKTVVFDTDKEIDFEGKEVNSNVNPAFRITNDATVTVKNGNMNTAEGYNFILGASDSSSAGNLTIESGTFHGATTVASVTMGSLNITGGEFSVEPYQGNYAFLINCYDPNYNNGAEVSISGGTFHKWNPENNAAEGVNTNFCAPGHVAVYDAVNDTYTVIEANYVAKIGEVKYISLQAAIDAAQGGNTIVLLADITEDVTVNKSLTIDGKAADAEANSEYTGNIKISGNVNVTINEVAFVNGYVEHTSSNNTGTITIKYCSFANGGYAITTSRIKSVTIENCEVTNQSLLYAKLSTSDIVVKNVNISKGNYVAHIVYGSTAYFENVNATEMTGYGIQTQNYGAKTITINNCKFETPNYNSIAVRDDRTEAIDTFIFKGTNEMTSLKDTDKANYVLAEVEATLKAPEGYTVNVTEELKGQGYVVEYVNGVYSVVAGNVLNQTTGNKYATLQAAIDAASTGNTIVLLKDITENVTVGKNVTIDGAEKNYTGKMEMTNKADITVKNVNFDGKGYNGYAIESRGAYYITVEDCTAKNYGYGFIQLASGNVLTTIKDVTVSNMNYGVKVDYSNAVVLENLNLDCAVAAVLNSNYGEKTITIKNSNLSILGTWKRNNTIKTTYVFEGANTVDQFIIEEELDNFKLADVNSTLTAPNEITVTTDVEGYKVDYADGKYFLRLPNYVAQIGETKYESLTAAISAASAGNTIVLLADINENVTVDKKLTIDGDGHNSTGLISTNKNVTYTFKNFNIDGANSYFVKVTGGGGNYVFDNCNIKNSLGLIYTNKATNTVSVRNSIVDNCEYGVAHFTALNSATLENVTVQNSARGLMVQNQAAKTIKFVGCNISATEPVYIWDKGTSIITFNFEGENTFDGELGVSTTTYGKLVLTTAEATLTAPQGYNVTTTVEGLKVYYADSKYYLGAPDYVAAIGEVQYESLQAAIDAAQDGDEIDLIKGIYVTEVNNDNTTEILVSGGVSYRALYTVSGKSVTIDLNDNILYSTAVAADFMYNVFAVANGGHLTIKTDGLNGHGQVRNEAASSVYSLLFCYDGTLTIESGNYYLKNGESGCGMIYSQQDETVTVNGGKFILENVGTLSNGSPWIFNAKGQNTQNIIVNGGTFNDDILHQYYPFEVMAQKEKALKYDAVEELWTMEDAVAYVDEQHKSGNWYTNEVGFVTLEEAFAAAAKYNHNDTYVTTVTLLANVELSTYVTISKSVNLNLGQFNITRVDGTALYFNGEGIEVTIDGEGTVSGTQAVYVDNGTVTINGGNYVGGYEAVYVINNGHAVINGGTFGAENDEDDTDFVLNEYDATRDVTTIAVYGGTFHGFNPENNAAEGAGTNFCAPGHSAVETAAGSDIWEVMPVQKQNLVKGWNWYSSYLDITTENLLGALGTNGKSIVQNSTWSATYYGVNDGTDYGWGYESHIFDVSKMYMIETSQACELALSGNLVDASEITITLNPGWNWIGYPSNVEVRLEDALDGLQPSHGDEIKTQGAFASYYDYEGQSMWLTYSFGNGNMKPTKGYMYNNTSGETKTFTYNIVPATTRGNNETEVATHYSVDYTKYPFNMTMTAVVDGAIGDNYEVAALVNGEVRGSARPVYVEVLDAYMLFLTISGDNVEEVSFKYYDLTTGEEYDLVNRIDYSNNAMVGSVNEPYVLSRGTTGIGDAAMSQVNIYPNPTTTGTEINLQTVCDTVEVFNALGVKVAEYQNVDSIDALETAGIYVIRITNDGNVQNCRLVVK